MEQLFDRIDEPPGEIDVLFTPILSVELVRDDLRLGGGGGATGTNDLTVFGKGPNMSSGREMLVIG